jgi:hypothetical protein
MVADQTAKLSGLKLAASAHKNVLSKLPGVLRIHSSFSFRNVLMAQPSSGAAFDCPSPLRPSRAAGPACSQLSYSGSLKSKQSSGNAHKHDKNTPV